MAVFSGNPADRRMGAAPGSVAEAARAGTSRISNGTTRNNNFGGQTSRAEPGGGIGRGLAASTRVGGFAGSVGYSNDRRGNLFADQQSPAFNAARAGVRLGPNAAMAVRDAGYSGSTANTLAEKINVGAAWDSDLDKQLSQAQRQASIESSALNTSMGVRGIGVPKSSAISKSSTGPVSRGRQSPMSTPSARMSGIQDYKSIVPGKVTMTAEKVPFAQKNPSLAKYMGGTPAKPVKVSVEEAKKMATTVPKVGAYISGASTVAKQALGPDALKQIGTVKKGYGTTTIQANKGIFSGTIDISYPKSVATGKSFGTYKAGPLSSTGPVSRGVQAKSSTGPVSRGVQPAPRMSTGPVSRGIQTTREAAPAAKTTVQQVRVKSKQNKAATVASRVTKDGYVYTRVGNRLQNFGAAPSSNKRDANRTRRKEK